MQADSFPLAGAILQERDNPVDKPAQGYRIPDHGNTIYRGKDHSEGNPDKEVDQVGQSKHFYISGAPEDAVHSAFEAHELSLIHICIREEAVSQGYLRLQSQTSRKPVKLAPRRYRSSDGFLILSGRNNLQNDQLTLREASNYDLWLHTQKIPGSHTIIITDGVREIPQRTIEEAAVIAACNSSARESAKVPVDYTYIKNVRKPRGARPGMVIYDPYQTAIVDPDLKRAEALREK